MKQLILAEILLLFLATTFQSDSTGGWVQQTLPVNKTINDIFFIDSLTGWVVTAGASNTTDTGYILKTTTGGNNWSIQHNPVMNFNRIQFVDNNTGYAGGGNGLAKLFKTTTGGSSWFLQNSFGFITIVGLFFVNRDTGWICDDNPLNGAVFKTTNGGTNWQPQLGLGHAISTLFFLNKDTGWASGIHDTLWRTTNGGVNWNFQHYFSQFVGGIYFFNGLEGVLSSGNHQRTTDGGFTWMQSNLPGGYVSFVNDSIGWSGLNWIYVKKTTNGGVSWFYQNSPINDNTSIFAIDSLRAWAGGYGLVHTSDGGGPPVGIEQISSEVPNGFKLYQNYPNPFNPGTVISYQLRVNGYVRLIVFDITGREIASLVNQKQNAGTYEVDWNANNLPSGVYFYQLIVSDEHSAQAYKETKKMILLK